MTGRPLRWAAPLGLFVLLCALRGISAPGGGESGWLDRAGEIVRQWSQHGASPLRLLAPVEDPRVGPAAMLLRLSLPAPWVAALLRLIGVGMGAIGVLHLARRRQPTGATLGAWLLAASPLWVESCTRGDPSVALGLVFVMLGSGALPLWLVPILLGWSLGWSPWAWVTLLLLPIGRLLQPQRRRDAVVALVAGIVLLGFLAPAAALSPLHWLSAMRWQARVGGLGSGLAPFGTGRGAWPAIGALHLAALVLLLWSARRWPNRVRGGDFAPVACLVALGLGLPSSLAHVAPLLVVLPWAAGEAGAAFGEIRAIRVRHRAAWVTQWVLPVVLVAPLLVMGASRWTRAPAGGDARREVTSWVDAQVSPGSLMACDVGFTPLDSSRVVWLTLPFHSVDPSIYRGAYWHGWYGAFRGVVVSERVLGRLLQEGGLDPGVLGFYLWLKRSAATERLFGQQPGRHFRVVLLPSGSQPALAEGWKARVRQGGPGGLPGAFLAGLGGALVRGGRVGEGIDLLEEALAAGYRDQGIYVNLANGRIAAGQWTEAGLVLEDALKAYPEAPDLLHNLGLVLVRVGYWERAIQVLGQLRQIWPRSAETTYLLGAALARTGRTDAARQALEDALDLGLGGSQRQSCMDLLGQLQGTSR